ncbi:pre-mRNA-splicing factor CDC5/CEF1 [Malassezia restricta]|uniref:pre-mRNA-splicing factor CDC5/CEF1 n=1 Tax=Malassezia restricta TaxID=76775 RepID=UPI000DD0F958|nr:pre-mRNA-splicing factor CDC5/CEF1 [Malassezia restricta]AXA50500.1 pre-mRNA-splicing factor CDC5/CEF1 [Malassezia restricta]
MESRDAHFATSSVARLVDRGDSRQCGMVRVVKGGVWKNTEDEILKAAVSKYGMNQWARISSLLVRKTPKQCKARWYEWLDPSIKKIEWSREEDEKLLHMAKLMPTQWRTIAPIVGRTATQCLERYQQLLDDADAHESGLGLAGPGVEAAPSADQVLKLRPGEIDPDPESRPAKPDPVDMDEDEKEMLSEARARLANTEGKKAKRKARERALDEARRLSTLQKRRELRAAGIVGKGRDKAKGIDYNAEIPFEKQPLPGFYDTSAEAAKTYEEPMRRTLLQMEPGPQPTDEEAKRKRDKAMNKPSRHEEALRRMQEADKVSKRRKLMLPHAQVSEADMEQIIKLGHAGEEARALVEHGESATEGLLGTYTPIERPAPDATPARAPVADALVREARELHARTVTQTPLLGDENVPMPSTARPSEPASTPAATPYRDALGLNDGSATPRDAKMQARIAKRQLAARLAALPAPKNDFDIVVDEPPVPEPIVHDDVEEDAAVRDARLAQEAAEERERAWARRTQVVQRALPRPVDVNPHQLEVLLASLRASDDEAQRLVDHEVVQLMAQDARVFPLPGSRNVGGQTSALWPVPDTYLAQARALVEAETLHATEPSEPVDMPEAWAPDGTRVFRDTLSREAYIQGAQQRLEVLRTKMNDAATQALKSEKLLSKLLGGYQARSRRLGGQVTEAAAKHADMSVRISALERLASSEPAAGQERLERIAADVARLSAIERMAQGEHKELQEQRAAAQEAWDEIQTELDMRRAEAALLA